MLDLKNIKINYWICYDLQENNCEKECLAAGCRNCAKKETQFCRDCAYNGKDVCFGCSKYYE